MSSVFGVLIDYITPFLSTADAGSDGYVCYHFWETAKAENEHPVFFTCSLCLIALSSFCGVSMFLLQNWGRDDDDEAGNQQGNPYVALGLEEDHEAADADVETRQGWFPRLCIKSKLNRLVGCADDMPLLALLVQFFLVILLLALLLPFGQLLPIVLWLQAKQEQGKAPKRPVKPEAPPQPKCPEELKVLNAGREPAGKDFFKMYQLASDEQKEALKDFYVELRDWRKEFTEWHFTTYLPYLDMRDRYFQWEVRVKVTTHLPFVIETSVEAIPQSLLQTTAIVIESQRSVDAISWVQFVSIGMSMVSIASKAYIVCTSMIRPIFNFKMICFFSDLAALFYTVAAFWSTRRGDKDAVEVFFLTRPVDLFTAIYLWAAFAWSCLFASWLLLRSLVLIYDWLFLEHLFDDMTENDRPKNFGAVHGAIRSVAAKWPTKLSFIVDSEFETSKTPAASVALFVFVSSLFMLVAVTGGLLLIIVPVLILLLLPRMFWVCAWLKRMESEMHDVTLTPRQMSRENLIESFEPQKISEIGGKVFCFKDEERCFLYIADNPEALGSARSRVDVDLEVFLTSRFGPASPRSPDDTEVVANEGSLLWVLPIPTEFYMEMKLMEDVDEATESQQKKSSFYAQTFAWTTEGPDFFARLSALKHALMYQHVENDEDELQKTTKVSLPGCLLLRFFYQVIANISEVFSLLQAPFGYLPHWDRRLVSSFAYLGQNAMTKMIDALQDEQLEDDIGDDEGIEFPESIENIKNTERNQKMFASCRGLCPYVCLYRRIILPLGWLVQKLLMTMTALVATCSLLFPVVSFSLSCWRAIQDNTCSDSRIFHGGINITQSTLLAGLSSLFDENCYGDNGRPLNWFRGILFLGQGLLLVAAILYGIFAARKFIIFAMVVPKYGTTEWEHAFSDAVKDLKDRVQIIYEHFYSLDLQKDSDMQNVVGKDEEDRERNTDDEEEEE